MEVDNRPKGRRALGDITNTQSDPKSPVALQKLPPQLVQEKEAFLKQIQHQNKIIELAGIEVQNLRNCLVKMQQQNQSLAQYNTQMLAELNRDKQRLKEVQHELAIFKGLFKVTKQELEELKKVNRPASALLNKEAKVIACETGHEENSIPSKACKRVCPSRSQHGVNIPTSELPKVDKETEAVVFESENSVNVLQEDFMTGDPAPELPNIDTESIAVACESGHDGNNVLRKPCKRGHPSRSQSLGVPVVPQLDAEKVATETKRLRTRGNSFSSSVPHEDVHEMDGEKIPELKPSNDLSKDKGVEACDGSQFSDKESQRTSTGRPMRRSAARVQSYKETLKGKLRRPG